MPATATERTSRTVTERRLTVGLSVVGGLVAAFLVFALVYVFTTFEKEPSVYDAALPNPMGGPARVAPGEADGTLELGGLTVAGSEVAMGDVPLNVTVVPSWQVTNPTDAPITFAAGQPQVLEGCCPGPVYADGELTQAGQELVVPAGGAVTVQFPLQMHPGMDGPHHLQLPVVAGGDREALHVTGNFTAEAV